MPDTIKKIHQQTALKLVKQAGGTLSKIMEMIDEDRYCPEIIQQIEAINGLMKSAKRELLQGHLNGCLERKLSEDKAQTIEELIKIYNLSN